ncbi:MAG TPA: hypothetical protein VEJ63_15230 [Planctomycetota bacterium]|nr:hypothetical protein [Planctomycetota bacterium]
MKRNWRNRSILFVLGLLGAAAPLAQIVHVIEERATESAPARYEFSASLAPQAPEETESSEPKNTPRLIKLLTDHWDVTASIAFHIDVPAPATAMALAIRAQHVLPESYQLLFASGPPLVPASRGPPAA